MQIPDNITDEQRKAIEAILNIGVPQQDGKNSGEKKKHSRKLPKVLKPGQAAKFLNAFNINCITGLRDRCVFETLYRCGLRIEEVCKLKMEDVDLEEGYFYIQNSKGGKDRTVPMDNELLEWLKKWNEQRPQKSEYFFSTLKGGKLDKRQLRNKCSIISEKAGVYIRDGDKKRKVWPHALRHTCLTECLEEGFNLAEIQQLAGHENIKTTSIYLSVRPQMLKKKMQERKKNQE